MKHYITEAKDAPPPSGPYSLGVVGQGKFLFVSGQGPWDHEKREYIRGDIATQTLLTFRAIEKIVVAAGGTMKDVVSCRVYLQPLTAETFAEMNAAYETFFPDAKPTRTTIGATLLDIDVEIDCIVCLD